jgi:UDP-3-O-[3-hydroxymyristoyl] glucosamine N-acyltransferase
MADPRFYSVAGPFGLEKLAAIAKAEIAGTPANRGADYRDVAPLSRAGPTDVSFLDNRRYLPDFKASRAGACLVAPDVVKAAPNGMVLLVTREPYAAYARVAAAFYPRPAPRPGTDTRAAVGPDAKIGEGCRIDAGAVIGVHAEIGRRCHVAANAVVGDGVVVGDDCYIGPGASLAYCVVGSRVIIHAGARIGQDGFGFAPGSGGHVKVPQLGRVVIGDDVEIGANTTIDRGAGPDTIVGAGTKIDNLVQIAHNVELGRGCIVVAQVGISGSTKIGDFVMLGGQAGLTGHLTIGGGAKIAAQAGVMRDIEPGVTVGGSPAVPMREWLKGVAIVARMARKEGG